MSVEGFKIERLLGWMAGWLDGSVRALFVDGG